MHKSTVDEIRARFDADVERFSNLETGQAAAVDAPLQMDLVTEAAAGTNPDATAVLDIGCGAGNYTLKLLGRLATPRDVTATLVDLSRPMLDRAQQRIAEAFGSPTETVRGDIRAVDLGRSRFDIVLAAQCLHHLRDEAEWRAVFEAIYASLKPGGSLWVSDSLDHEPGPVDGLMRRRWGEHLVGLKDEAYRDHVFAYVEQEDTPRPLLWQTDLMRGVGFERVEVLHKVSRFGSFGGVKPAAADDDPSTGGEHPPEPERVTLKDGRAVTIRPARVSDAEAVVAFMRLNIPEADRFICTTAEDFDPGIPAQRERIRATAAGGALFLLAVTGDGEVVGSLGIGSGKRVRERHRAGLGMAIRAAWRGVGLGSALMETALAWAEAHPTIRKVHLAAYADNAAAIALYRKFGFEQEGVKRGHLQREPGEFVDCVEMGRWVGEDAGARIP